MFYNATKTFYTSFAISFYATRRLASKKTLRFNYTILLTDFVLDDRQCDGWLFMMTLLLRTEKLAIFVNK